MESCWSRGNKTQSCDEEASLGGNIEDRIGGRWHLGWEDHLVKEYCCLYKTPNLQSLILGGKTWSVWDSNYSFLLGSAFSFRFSNFGYWYYHHPGPASQTLMCEWVIKCSSIYRSGMGGFAFLVRSQIPLDFKSRISRVWWLDEGKEGRRGA